ncbi:MAG: hypothetical protein LC645_08270 [Geobacteraceae bacterium]|nr:hypothetical protein [Geobacteraceae bacterium]
MGTDLNILLKYANFMQDDSVDNGASNGFANLVVDTEIFTARVWNTNFNPAPWRNHGAD